MFNFTKSKFDESINIPVSATAVIAEPGQVLVAADDGNGDISAKPSAGTSGEVFLGLAIMDRKAPASLPGVFTFTTVTAVNPATVTLGTISNFVAGTARVFVNGVYLDHTAAGAPIQINTTTGVVTQVADGTGDLAAGLSVVIQARYSPTVQQVQRLMGDYEVVSALDYGANVGVTRRGTFYTSNYDTSVTWTIGAVPNTGAGGNLTIGGSGGATNMIVVHTPTAAEGFLGVWQR